ncbi:MAG: sugar transferase [Gemmatimonadaceae bacterium]|nr:sugar transferase [Acetobacteraceae bacterium]
MLHVAVLIGLGADEPSDWVLPLIWATMVPAILLMREGAEGLFGGGRLARRPARSLVVMKSTEAGPASHDGPASSVPQRYRANHPLGRAAKIALDRAGASAICLVAAPVLLGVAFLVTRDGGPLLFRHRRVGHNGEAFMCLKFRTMVVDADAVLAELLARNPAARAEWDATQKLRDDPRVTRYGRLLRNTSLDELPQLLNILRGEMSLVGPRPIVPAEVPRYGDDIALYFAAIPGLTGLWQVSGRSDTSYQRRVELDCEYVRTWSFWGDVAILLKTIPAVVLKRGAV